MAVIVRAHRPRADDTALLTFPDGEQGQLVLRAASPGMWGARLVAGTDGEGRLVVADTATGHTESFADLSRLDAESGLVRVQTRPERLRTGLAATLQPPTNDGDPPDAGTYRGAFDAVRRADLVNLLVVPGEPETEVVADAMALATSRRAVFLRDPPAGWSTVSAAVSGAASPAFPRSRNTAVYFPRIRQPGPLRGPGGTVAGVIARSDLTRGVWRSPAGLEADIDGIEEFEVNVTDVDGSRLHPLGVNCIRTFPGTGPVVWGARTTDAGEWKYLTVRRTALFVEESLDRGTRWARFEPNDEPLWARIRAEAGAFLNHLFRRGAFAGTTPPDAWFVRCDRETTTRDDVDRGVVNILVGFAPIKPAEFVVLNLRQAAGLATPPP